MPTVQTVTVKSAGGDYTSLSAAEAGEQTNLVTDDVQLDIECYAFQDTSAVTFDGWTTDATRYIRVIVPSAERHSGAWNTAKYRLETGNAFVNVVQVNEDYTQLVGLQTRQTGATGNHIGQIRIQASNCLIDSLIQRAGGGAAAADGGSGILFTGAAGDLTIRNSVIYGCLHTGIYEGNFVGGVVRADNVTIAGCGAHGFNGSSGAGNVLRNVYSGGNATDDYSGTMTRTTCAHSSATVFTGSTASIAHDTTNFTNVTGGSEDLHLVTGSDLIDAGTDLSGTFTTDIDGETRSGTWDIGADEFVSGGGGLSIPICMYHYQYHCGA